MVDTIEISSKSGLRFRMHKLSSLSTSDFRINPETNQLESTPFPCDIADLDPLKAVELAKSLDYTEDSDGVWVDPIIPMLEGLELAARAPDGGEDGKGER